MSCGNHHDRHCADVLYELHRFIDHELDDASTAEIQQHLDECGPCLREHEVDMIVQRLVARSCADRAPDTLRERVRLTLHQVVQIDVQLDPRQPPGPTPTPAPPGAGLPWQGPQRRL